MIRHDLIKSMLPVLRDRLVVCNIGAPSQELYSLHDQPSNFYMLGTMGLCSSIALGLALVQNEPVIALDGDGSVLTNLGTLATLGNNQPRNLILVIIDNGSYGSTGDQTTYAGLRTSLSDVAVACGCSGVVECSAEETTGVISGLLERHESAVVVSKCDSGNVDVPVIDLDPVYISQRFMREITRRNSGGNSLR